MPETLTARRLQARIADRLRRLPKDDPEVVAFYARWFLQKQAEHNAKLRAGWRRNCPQLALPEQLRTDTDTDSTNEPAHTTAEVAANDADGRPREHTNGTNGAAAQIGAS